MEKVIGGFRAGLKLAFGARPLGRKVISVDW
jgi:hypothetical protein